MVVVVIVVVIATLQRKQLLLLRRYAQENDTWGEDYKREEGEDADFQPKLPATLILDVDKKPTRPGEEEEELIEEDLAVSLSN